MKTRSQLQEQERIHAKKKITITAIAAAVVVIAIVAVIILVQTGSHSTIKNTLETYYQTMYTSNGKGFDDMAACYAPDLSEEWYNSNTLQGMNFYSLNTWRMEAINQVGINPKCEVEIIETKSGTSLDLVNMQQSYRGTQAVSDVIFKLHLSGDTGSMVIHGVAEMVKVDNKWGFASTNIPMSVESREGSAQEWYDAHGEQGE